MSSSTKFAAVLALLALGGALDARADPKTVCTITVNSPDEKEIFRRNLPAADYQFVELVQHGNPDWFQAACHKGIRCDVLLVSGHFDDGTEFYSDRVDTRESLPVEVLERASCSESCPGLFSQLKEVYLFGCNTLEAAPLRSASGELVRSLVRSGHTPADAERMSRELANRHGESNRDRMRQVFKDVPVIYGFSAKAPLGAAAAPVLGRYFQTRANSEVGNGRVSPTLLGLFSPVSMTATAGLRDADADAAVRGDYCQFSDARLSAEQKLAFIHRLLSREMAEVRLFLDRIERYVATLSDAERRAPAVMNALNEIARDHDARRRYLDFARDADLPSVRGRMIVLAGALGWLSPVEKRAELEQMVSERLGARDLGVADVELVCSLNKAGELERTFQPQPPRAQPGTGVAQAAVLACVGGVDSRARVIRALASSSEADVEIAQAYLHQRPLVDTAELRDLGTAILRMTRAEAQVRALDTLAAYRLADRELLQGLTRLFALATSIDLQRAIAGVLIRSDYAAIATPDLVRVLREHRVKSPDGSDVIDVLIRRMQFS